MSQVHVMDLVGDESSTSWRDASICRDLDPSVFFPIGVTGVAIEQIARAKAICAEFPVRTECLDFAIATKQDFGVWGGYDEEERRGMRRRLRAVQAGLRGRELQSILGETEPFDPFEADVRLADRS